MKGDGRHLKFAFRVVFSCFNITHTTLPLPIKHYYFTLATLYPLSTVTHLRTAVSFWWFRVQASTIYHSLSLLLLASVVAFFSLLGLTTAFASDCTWISIGCHPTLPVSQNCRSSSHTLHCCHVCGLPSHLLSTCFHLGFIFSFRGLYWGRGKGTPFGASTCFEKAWVDFGTVVGATQAALFLERWRSVRFSVFVAIGLFGLYSRLFTNHLPCVVYWATARWEQRCTPTFALSTIPPATIPA